MTEEPLLSSEEVATVLSGGEVEKPDGPESYSLRRPRVIATEMEPIAKAHLDVLAAELQGALQHELGSEISLEIQGFQQQQARSTVETLSQPAWFLTFLAERGGGMALALDPSCALSLVELVLGGAGNTVASDRGPTPLESRLMDKLCSALTPRLGKRAGVRFKSGSLHMNGLPAEMSAPGQTVGVGLLKLRIAEADRNGLLLATPGLLRESTGREPGGDGVEAGPLAQRLEEALVEMRPLLIAGRVSLSELRELKPDTVLRLDASAETLLQLRVAGEVLFTGKLVRREDGLEFHAKGRRGWAVGDEKKETT